jgi:hypothetical protein
LEIRSIPFVSTTSHPPIINSHPKKVLTAQVEDAIASADVRQERIAKSLAFCRSLHQTGDVDDIQVRWDFAAMKSERKIEDANRARRC